VRWISSRPDAARLTTVKTYQLVKQTLTSQFALHHAWVVYDALHECGEKRVRLSNKELASRVGLGRSTVAKVMTVLEQLGCIATRYPDGVDNRARVIMVPRTLSGLAVARLHGIVDGTVSVDWSAARLVCQVKELAEVLGATLVHAEFGADEPEFLLFDAADSSTEPPLGDEASAGGASLRGVGGCSFLECFETNDHCSMLRDAITSTATDAKALTEDNAIALIQRASIQEEEQALTRELSGPELEVLTHELHEASGVKRGVTLADQRLVSEALKRFTPQELLAAVRWAAGLPGWHLQRTRGCTYADLRVVLPHPNLISRLLAGHQVHPVGCIVERDRQELVQKIFKGWRRAMQYGAEHTLTEKQFHCIAARLDEAFTPEQLLQVAKWIAAQPFYRGDNERGKPFDDPCSIWRSKDRVLQHLRACARPGVVDRRFIELAASDQPTTSEQY
jgi:DNA-binding MarR family transcriptional regulator